jgi:hypothetical protein
MPDFGFRNPISTQANQIWPTVSRESEWVGSKRANRWLADVALLDLIEKIHVGGNEDDPMIGDSVIPGGIELNRMDLRTASLLSKTIRQPTSSCESDPDNAMVPD